MKDYRVIHADVREGLRSLPDESVHCIITSPPYWNLRDYQTASWQGGDAACDHLGPPKPTQAGFNERSTEVAFIGNKQGDLRVPYRDVCGKCGARRVDKQLGLEETPQEYVEHMVEICREARRVLRKDGVFFLNIGDCYIGYKGANYGVRPESSKLQAKSTVPRAHDLGTPHTSGLKSKDLVMMPARVALALQADGWYLRDDIAWVKAWQDEDGNLEGNTMPGSQEDRFTSAWEHIFLLTRSERYFFDLEAVKTRSGATPRNVLRVNTRPFKGSHFATFPPALVAPLIKAGTSEYGVCPECLAPWQRMTEHGDIRSVGGSANPERHKRQLSEQGPMERRRADGSSASQFANQFVHRERNTLGWEPTCRCGRDDTVPATVLDMFWGAGTTGLVALRLGRRALGIELNASYIEMSHKRIMADEEAMNLRMTLVEAAG